MYLVFLERFLFISFAAAAKMRSSLCNGLVASTLDRKNARREAKLRGRELNPGLPRDRRKY